MKRRVGERKEPRWWPGPSSRGGPSGHPSQRGDRDSETEQAFRGQEPRTKALKTTLYPPLCRCPARDTERARSGRSGAPESERRGEKGLCTQDSPRLQGGASTCTKLLNLFIRGSDRAPNHWFTPQDAPNRRGWARATAGSQELGPGLPPGWQGADDWSHPCCLPGWA